MNGLHPIPGCRIEQIVRVPPAGLKIVARGVQERVCCPACRCPSTSPHGSYLRRPADPPSVGRQIRLTLRVRRF
ncbi:transposase family protein [Roseomonas chloroacetimidivorans]|uniref:transposase family protein n=1 Tax=Roseomonas chloroacetimidivorans TaxID=1766656 RepID=UPI003C74E29B